MTIQRGGICVLLMALASAGAHAEIHLSNIDGHEARVVRGRPAVSRPLAVSGIRGSVFTVNAGPDIDAANNDYRRIQDAINAAVPADQIVLNGTFNFTAPFAAAAWALGNDGIASTSDDYSVLVPAGLNQIFLTANSLGSAVIQGPGDLAAVDLEGFLLFNGGDNQNWTISNLAIWDFDLAIGMFSGAGGADAFDGTTITDNQILIPNDLNATIAPADTLQNIGIHLSFGANQLIQRNAIATPGDASSDGANASSVVGVQSNVSGGAVYDGLRIVDNSIRVLNFPSANPQNLIGYWENGQAHNSNITVSGNTFRNQMLIGSDAALNLQRAFRVTSHSSATSTVRYAGSDITGANIGFQWQAGLNFTGSEAVVLERNNVEQCATGVLIQSEGSAHLADNTIINSRLGGGVRLASGRIIGTSGTGFGMLRNLISGGSGDGVWIEATAGVVMPLLGNDFSDNDGFGVRNDSVPIVLAEYNWWGSNDGAEVAAEVSGNVDFDPWMYSATGLFKDDFE
jgi:hypothetical protein